MIGLGYTTSYGQLKGALSPPVRIPYEEYSFYTSYYMKLYHLDFELKIIKCSFFTSISE